MDDLNQKGRSGCQAVARHVSHTHNILFFLRRELKTPPSTKTPRIRRCETGNLPMLRTHANPSDIASNKRTVRAKTKRKTKVTFFQPQCPKKQESCPEH